MPTASKPRTSSEPAFYAPGVPPIGSVVPGPSLNGWHGFIAPAKTPPEIIGKLQTAIRAAIADGAVQAKLKAQGIIPVGDGPAEFSAFIAEQRRSNAEVIAKAGIKLD